MSSEALNILHAIKASTLKNAAPLPLKEAVQAEWQGLGFVVGGMRLVSRIGDVSELMAVPRLTKLPAVKPWVLGIANVRGSLLPIIDLHEYLGIPTTQPSSLWRVLVVEDGEIAAGLVVEQSIGMQHFLEASFEPSDGSELGQMAQFVKGAFRHGGRVYHEVELKAILRDEKFSDVALGSQN